VPTSTMGPHLTDSAVSAGSYYLSSHRISCHSDGHEANKYGM